MIALFGAVFMASLLGSLHCAGMCGAFVAFAVAGSDDPKRPAPRWALATAYNLGRLATYTLLGAVAGWIGSAVDLGGSAVGVRNAAAVLAGSMMVIFGLITALRLSGFKIARAPLPPGLATIVAGGHRLAAQLTPVRRALAIGLLTTLLPCGWLYAFAITAAGTANPLIGAAMMAVFWLGTLPMMAALGAGIQSLAGPLRQKVPVATAVILVVVGLYTIVGRFRVPPLASSHPTTLVSTHEDGPIGRVPGDQDKLPCCNGN